MASKHAQFIYYSDIKHFQTEISKVVRFSMAAQEEKNIVGTSLVSVYLHDIVLLPLWEHGWHSDESARFLPMLPGFDSSVMYGLSLFLVQDLAPRVFLRFVHNVRLIKCFQLFAIIRVKKDP